MRNNVEQKMRESEKEEEDEEVGGVNESDEAIALKPFGKRQKKKRKKRWNNDSIYTSLHQIQY